jgi:NifU-like protein involved in Fe-S cluster formation
MSEPELPPTAKSHFVDPYHQGVCGHATHVAEGQWDQWGELCLELTVDGDGTIVEAWFDGEGSPWMLAAASLFVESIEGCPLDTVQNWNDDHQLASCESELDDERDAWLLPLTLLKLELESVDAESDDEDGPRFQGPHLGEEC